MKPQVSCLSNGLRIVSLNMPGVETAALALNADVGARHETAAENGLAHLFEHMVFKGTATRSARAIAEAIEDVGGSLNAWTSRDTTVFHARILADDMPLALSLIAELILAPRFDPADMMREKQVVLSEIGEAADTPDDIIFDHLQMVAYPDQPLGRPILGTESTLSTFIPASLASWRDRLYLGSNLVLSAAGGVDHDSLVRQAEALFSTLPASTPPPPVAARWQGGTHADQRRAEQTHIALAFEGPYLHAPNYFAAQIFATALGGGMSSRLFQGVREEHGLAYSISASHGAYTDSGMLSLYLATQSEDAQRALAMVRDIAAQTARDLEPAELERARAQLKAGLLMGLEGCAGQADWLGRTIITHGRPLSSSEVIAALDAVNVEDARRAGQESLSMPPALAVVGPKADLIVA